MTESLQDSRPCDGTIHCDAERHRFECEKRKSPHYVENRSLRDHGSRPTLVERLRWHAMDRSNLHRSLTAEAAVEIERLRLALREISALPALRRVEGWHQPYADNASAMKAIAMEALRNE